MRVKLRRIPDLSRTAFSCLIAPMLNSVPLFIGLRYIRSKRRSGFITFVSLFALLGMALGVFSLIVVLSVMNGFDNELKQRILRVIPHGYLTTDEPLKEWQELARQVEGTPGLLATAPFVEGRGLVSFYDSVRPIEVQGVLPDLEKDVSAVDEHMLLGDLDDLVPGEYGIVLGSIIAQHLHIARGDKVTVLIPQVSITPAGVFPRSKRFTVVGVFEAGAQVDQTLALIHIEDAKTLFRRGGAVDGLRLKFADIYQAPLGVENIAARLGEGYEAKNWSETQGSLFQAVKMEKTVVGIMLGIIIAVAAFNIVTSLVLMVAEKRNDIAVLRTLGMTRGGVVKIFMVQGIATGITGIIFGAVFGVTTANFLSPVMAVFERVFGLQIFDPSVYFVTSLPSLWKWQDTAMVCGFAVLVSLLATIYPAIRAARIEPAEALRYDG